MARTEIPDLIEREILIEAPVEVVWRLVTEPEQITAWFSDAAELDLRPGGSGVLAFDLPAAGDAATKTRAAVDIQVEAVEPPHRFSFRWVHPEGTEPRPGNSALVEFTLTSEGRHTRLRVAESGLSALDWPDEQKAGYCEEHTKGWAMHLDRMHGFVARWDRASAA